MVKVNRLPECREIKMQKRNYSELTKTFQTNFKTLVDFYGISFQQISYDQDIETIYVEKIYKGEYETLSPFIILCFSSYFGTEFYEITHHRVVTIKGELYYL
ncbi:MAG: hypothetical protein KDC73_09285 [Ignavibacteriae bacterium]|nr:hypothetical protein [Ignavibacteriota bacterium]MCB0724890.1 hypothetical protein [Ignavibacteriota bacterium]MCB9242097.1 hypothetical protein [Ignavibacteriales bacterium]